MIIRCLQLFALCLQSKSLSLSIGLALSQLLHLRHPCCIVCLRLSLCLLSWVRYIKRVLLHLLTLAVALLVLSIPGSLMLIPNEAKSTHARIRLVRALLRTARACVSLRSHSLLHAAAALHKTACKIAYVTGTSVW